MKYFELEDYETLSQGYQNKITNLSNWIWNGSVNLMTIENWLENYEGAHDTEREKINALHLLSQFMHFELREVRAILESMYRDLYKKPVIKTLKKRGSSNIPHDYKNVLKNTRFIGIGNSSASSSLILYFFRQVNELPVTCFEDRCNIFSYDEHGSISGLKKGQDDEDILHYVFIDDLSASGVQADSEFQKIKIEQILENNPKANIHYLTMFNTHRARDFFEGNEHINVQTVFELDKTYKVFHEESRYYTKNQADQAIVDSERQFSESMCRNYLSKYSKAYMCGYEDSQLLLSFFYNTPDNTLPSFWSETDDWSPVFKRYDKRYNFG